MSEIKHTKNNALADIEAMDMLKDDLIGEKMNDMSLLNRLVINKSRKELEKFFKDKGFKNSKFAAEQFLKAQSEIEEDKKNKK